MEELDQAIKSLVALDVMLERLARKVESVAGAIARLKTVIVGADLDAVTDRLVQVGCEAEFVTELLQALPEKTVEG